jgi:hypothetical protein
MGLYSSGGGTQTSTTKVEYTPEEQAARNRIFSEAGSTFDNAKAMNGQMGYTGPRPVGPSGETQASWQLGANAAQRTQSIADKMEGANDFGLSSALYAESNPYLQSAIRAAQRPVVEQFTDAGGVLSAIRNSSVANGTFGGSRQGIAEGLAMRSLQDKLGDISATMSNDNYKVAMAQRSDAIKNAPMLAMLNQIPAQMFSQMGQQREGYQADAENYDANAREFLRSGMWEPLGNLANIIYGGSNGTQTTTSSIPKQNNTGQVLGSLGSAALMAMMFS